MHSGNGNPVDEQAVRAALSRIDDPHAGADLVASGAVKCFGIDGGKVLVRL